MLLAQYLYSLGFSVYIPRLKGHGTAPEQLANVTAEDWIRSYLRAVTIVKNTCQHVILGGFSAGGLLALEAASLHKDIVGCFAISPCLQLMDPATRLVPLVVGWNQIMDTLHLPSAAYRRFTNEPENLDTNYPLNYLSGVHQLERLIQRTRSHLSEIRSPMLLVQGDHDPVVNPASAKEIMGHICSEEKELAMMSFDRHVIVRGEGCEVVFERVGEFVKKIASRFQPPNSHRRTSP
jgi:esterase/lipase